MLEQPDAETIFHTTPEERAAALDDRRKRYVEDGPEELRPQREAVVRTRDAVMKAISRNHLAGFLLKRAEQEGATEEQLTELRTNRDKAKLLRDTTTEDARQAEAALIEATRQMRFKDVDPGNLEAANRILDEEADAIAEVMRSLSGARFGAVGGTIFRLLSELESAKKSEDGQAISRLEDELADAKRAETEVRAQAEGRRKAVEAIREGSEAKLAEMKKR